MSKDGKYGFLYLQPVLQLWRFYFIVWADVYKEIYISEKESFINIKFRREHEAKYKEPTGNMRANEYN